MHTHATIVTMGKRLQEAGHLVEAKSPTGRFRIRIITEGEGSSGIYSRELLENYGSIFANRPMFGNHPKDPGKPWERSPFEIRAKLGPTVEYEVVDGVAGLYADIIADDEVYSFLEKFHDVTGVSIFASGDGHENEDGKWVVESFDGSDPYTSVDFVVAPGRGGGAERVLESLRALEDSAASADAGKKNKEQNPMEISDLAVKVDALTEAFTALTGVLTPLAESLKPEEKPEVDVAAAVETALDKAAEADIPKELRGPVLEAAKSGGDVDEAISAQKAIVEAIKTKLTEHAEPVGRVVAGDSATANFRVGGWS